MEENNKKNIDEDCMNFKDYHFAVVISGVLITLFTAVFVFMIMAKASIAILVIMGILLAVAIVLGFIRLFQLEYFLIEDDDTVILNFSKEDDEDKRVITTEDLVGIYDGLDVMLNVGNVEIEEDLKEKVKKYKEGNEDALVGTPVMIKFDSNGNIRVGSTQE